MNKSELFKKRWEDPEQRKLLKAKQSAGRTNFWKNKENRIHMMASMCAYKPRIATDYTREEWRLLTYDEKYKYIANLLGAL